MRRSAPESVEFADGFEDFLGMTCNLHLAPLAAQNTGTVDQESAALDSHVLAAVKALLADHVEELAELFVAVAEQVKGQGFLVAKLVVGFQRIARYADHHRAGAAELVVQVAEFLRLDRAARSGILGVEIEH